MEEKDYSKDNSNLLKELGLLNDEKTSKRRRLPDYSALRFFDYEQCFAYYAKQIKNLRQAKIKGEVIVAKPVLLLALLDGIDERVFDDNEFCLNEWLETRYTSLMVKYTQSSQFTNITGIENPFWHLATDGFWNLRYGHEPPNGVSPSKKWLKEEVDYAYFDESLWILLQNRTWRTKLRDYIVEHKLSDSSADYRMAAEGLGMLVAILLAA